MFCSIDPRCSASAPGIVPHASCEQRSGQANGLSGLVTQTSPRAFILGEHSRTLAQAGALRFEPPAREGGCAY